MLLKNAKLKWFNIPNFRKIAEFKFREICAPENREIKHVQILWILRKFFFFNDEEGRIVLEKFQDCAIFRYILTVASVSHEKKNEHKEGEMLYNNNNGLQGWYYVKNVSRHQHDKNR